MIGLRRLLSALFAMRRGLTWQRVGILINVSSACRRWETEHHEPLRLPRYVPPPN
jgi:hypothetical protein